MSSRRARVLRLLACSSRCASGQILRRAVRSTLPALALLLMPLLCVVLQFGASTAQAQIAYANSQSFVPDITSTTADTSFTSTNSYSVVPGTQVLVVVFNGFGQVTGDNTPTVTWNGQTMNSAVSQIDGTATFNYSDIYYLVNPTSGTGSIAVSGTRRTFQVSALDLTGVKTTASPVAITAGAAGSATVTATLPATVPLGGFAVVGESGRESAAVSFSLTATGGAALQLSSTLDGADNDANFGIGVVPSLAAGTSTIAQTLTGATANRNVIATAVFTPLATSAFAWTGTAGTSWDTTTANWSGPGSTFLNGAAVSFSDAGTNTSIVVAAGGLAQSGMTFTNNAKNYSFSGGPITGAGSVTLNGTGMVTFASSNGYSGKTTINGGTLSISAATDLGFNPLSATPGNVAINGATLQITAGAAFNSPSIWNNSGITLGASGGTINVTSPATGTFATNEVAAQYRGIIAGAGNLTVTGGAGTNSGTAPYLLELGAANTFSGTNVTINNATVSFDNQGGTGPANILPTASILNLINNGWFVFNNGASNQQLAGLTGGTNCVVATTNGGNADTLTITPTLGANYTFAGVMGGMTLLGKAGNSNELGLNLSGSGGETLTGQNLYNGTTTIGSSAATLQITGAGYIGGGNYTGALANNGNLILNTTSNQTLGGTISGTGAIYLNGSNVTTLTSTNNTTTGIITVNAGTLQLGAGATGLDGSLPNTGPGIINNSIVAYNLVGSQTASYAISGTGSLAMLGTGSLTLPNSNSFSGGAALVAGLLQLGGATPLGAGNLALVGGTLAASSSSSYIVSNPLVVAGNVALGTATNNGTLFFSAGSGTLAANSSLTAVSPLVFSSSLSDYNHGYSITTAGPATAQFNGVIGGSISLNVSSGLTILNNTNTYSGPTTVSGGTLLLNALGGNTGALAGSAVTVSGGPTLLVNGNSSIGAGGSLTIAGGATTANQGTIDLRDNTINTLAVNGNLNLGGANGGSILDYDLSSTGSADVIASTGLATLAGTNTINLNPTVLGGGVANGNYTLITASNGLSASNFAIGTRPAGFYTFNLTTPTSSALVLTITGNLTPSTAYWTGAGSSLLGDTANNWGSGSSVNTSNWSTTQDGLTDPLQVPGPITTVIFTAANASGDAFGNLTTTLDNLYSINGLRFRISAGTITNVNVNDNGYSLTIGTGGLILSSTSNASGTISGSGSVLLNGNQSWANNSSSQSLTINSPVAALSGATTLTLSGVGSSGMTIGGNLSNGGGTLSLSSSQTGVTMLTGSNTYSGPTTVSAGTLMIGGAGVLGAGTYNSAITNNSAFVMNSSSNQVLGGVISGSGSLYQNGSAITTLTASNTLTGTTTINNGALELGTSLSGQDGSLSNSGGGVINNASLDYHLFGTQSGHIQHQQFGQLDQAWPGIVVFGRFEYL